MESRFSSSPADFPPQVPPADKDPKLELFKKAKDLFDQMVQLKLLDADIAKNPAAEIEKILEQAARKLDKNLSIQEAQSKAKELRPQFLVYFALDKRAAERLEEEKKAAEKLEEEKKAAEKLAEEKEKLDEKREQEERLEAENARKMEFFAFAMGQIAEEQKKGLNLNIENKASLEGFMGTMFIRLFKSKFPTTEITLEQRNDLAKRGKEMAEEFARFLKERDPFALEYFEAYHQNAQLLLKLSATQARLNATSGKDWNRDLSNSQEMSAYEELKNPDSVELSRNDLTKVLAQNRDIQAEIDRMDALIDKKELRKPKP